MPLLIVGGALCAWVAVGAGWMALDDRRRRRERRDRAQAERQAFCDRVQVVAAEARARRLKSLGWQGLRTLRVSAVVDECRDVRSFYLADPEGRPLPSYHPGQYLTLHLPQGEGGGDVSDDDSAKPVVRCYSLSDRPREEFYRVSVKRCWPPRDEPNAPPGLGSTALHTRIREGDLLKVAAPRGDFLLPPVGQEPVALLGAGIGVTPLLSMLLTQAHAGLERPAHLLLGMRSGLEFPFRQEVDELTASHDWLSTTVCYSRPNEKDAPADERHRRGRLTIDVVKDVLPSPDLRFYLCGPPGMMQDLVPRLLDWGVPDDRIHFEAFGPASVVRESATQAAKAAAGAKVKFVRSGVEAEWTGEEASLLAFAEKYKAPLDAGCRVGNCGSCAVKVLQGETAAIKSPGAQAAQGECLACVSVPQGDLVIDA
ncbi:MAG: 2Fe-2S iron-sulfur cluster-binding protein [Planctomycetota bacterium]